MIHFDFSDETPATAPPAPQLLAVTWSRVAVTPAMHATVAEYLIGKGPLWLESVLDLVREVEGTSR